MELVFNAESLRPPITGVGVYSYHLLRELLRNDGIGEIHCFSGTGWEGAQEQVTAALDNMSGEERDVGLLGRTMQRTRTLIGHVPGTKALYDRVMDRRFRHRADSLSDAVYHETNYLLKPCKLPAVITVHDLSYLKYPDYHKPELVTLMNHRFEESVTRARHIITPSNVIRDEVLERFDLPAARVSAIYHGVAETYHPRDASECGGVLDALGIGYKAYLLVSATLEPRKGLDALLDAWALLPAPLRRTYPLVLTGSSGWRNEALRKKMAPFIHEGTLIHLGYVDSKLLPVVFSGAAVFAYPSIYEGFGLPALDAMASGVPVVCRTGTSVAEFSRGDCLFCDSGAAEELAEALQLLLQDEGKRQLWSERGLARASEFTWQQCAARTLQVYHSVL